MCPKKLEKDFQKLNASDKSKQCEKTISQCILSVNVDSYGTENTQFNKNKNK